MAEIKFYKHEPIPVEMHKVRIVQKLSLLPAAERVRKAREGGFNTFKLHNRDIFLDMLTDSGTNAMSDEMLAAMMRPDDAYAGSETFYRMRDKLEEIFGTPYVLPAHQGRACENIIAMRFVKPGSTAIMNYHFTTTKAHVLRLGGTVEELIRPEGIEPDSDRPFKGDIDLAAAEEMIRSRGAENISYIRVEAGTNLIGGQPVSFASMRDTAALAKKYGIPSVLDASLLQDNLYFIKTRDESMAGRSIREITRMIADCFDVIYFSARKFGFARGGAILTRDRELAASMEDMVPMFEGFLTYGGMSVREMEAMTVGFDETMDLDVISQGPRFIEYAVRRLSEAGIPVITPAGGLGAHLDAMRICRHIPQEQYRAGALAAAMYIAGGIRGMERGTMSEEREPDGSEHIASMELLRLAFPRRVFTLSQTEYVIDRVKWLYDHRELIGGLKFTHEPPTLRFFTGTLDAIGDWPERLAAAYEQDFGKDQ